jgi:hypothetical protein
MRTGPILACYGAGTARVGVSAFMKIPFTAFSPSDS